MHHFQIILNNCCPFVDYVEQLLPKSLKHSSPFRSAFPSIQSCQENMDKSSAPMGKNIGVSCADCYVTSFQNFLEQNHFMDNNFFFFKNFARFFLRRICSILFLLVFDLLNLLLLVVPLRVLKNQPTLYFAVFLRTKQERWII